MLTLRVPQTLAQTDKRTPTANSFPGLGSTRQSYCCTCHLVYQQLQARQQLQLPRLTAYCHVSSKCPPALLVLGRASTQSTAAKKPMTAQPVGHEDREVHGSSRGAENGKQSSLPNKSQKRKNGVFLTENQDELNDKCSPLVQPQQAANPDNASTTTKRQRYRHKGVLRIRNRFRAYLKVDERQVSLGLYSTEDEAARAVDEGHIFQGLAPVNFKNEPYQDEIACVADNVDQFAKLKRCRQSSRQLSKAPSTSRFTGVRLRYDKWQCYMCWKRQVSLGCYGSEEEAAMVYDQARIYQNLAPVNFPNFPYNEEEIRQPTNFGKFIEQTRKQAMQATKACQRTRFNGVTWLQNRWAAYLTIPTEQAGRSPRVFLGRFDTDEEAARVVDKGRITHGLKAVNFPESEYAHHQISQVAYFGEQSRAEARRTIKARQLSRFTGVTWKREPKKWEAYVHDSYVKPDQKKGFKKRILGYFANEEDAARAADKGRIQNGQKAVNSEEAMYNINS